MPRTSIDHEHATSVLRAGHLVRVAFRDGDGTYLIPLGYSWMNAGLYGTGERGRKTALASREPAVAFQVDTAMETGMFEWESVTGTGDFAEVTDQDEARAALAVLQTFIADAPDWWRAEQAPRLAQGGLIVWRIIPASFSGVRYAP